MIKVNELTNAITIIRGDSGYVTVPLVEGTVTSGRITGTKILDKNNPAEHDTTSYSATEDGYMLIAKDNIGKSGIFTYVMDITEAYV